MHLNGEDTGKCTLTVRVDEVKEQIKWVTCYATMLLFFYLRLTGLKVWCLQRMLRLSSK